MADWNSKVVAGDLVYFLGDFAMGPKDKHLGFLAQLNGNIKIVPGNHDRYLEKIAKTGGLPSHVEMLPSIFNLKHGHTYFVLCHFPMDEWEGKAGHSSDHISGSIHLHGHTHGNLKTQRKDRWDIGYDVFGGPVLLDRFVP
jgi:calcineurin-like phosphoesterase family protein